MKSAPPSALAVEQFVDFATTGRLIVNHRSVPRPRRTIDYVVIGLGALAAVIGGVVAVVGAAVAESTAMVAIGSGVVVLATAMCMSAITYSNRMVDQAARIEPQAGAVLRPDLLRQGHWIHREGAWTRVLEVGQSREGCATILVSSGEVIDLDHPITVAGGAFAPADDPVEALRA